MPALESFEKDLCLAARHKDRAARQTAKTGERREASPLRDVSMVARLCMLDHSPGIDRTEPILPNCDIVEKD
jgi:hypothetical protein